MTSDEAYPSNSRYAVCRTGNSFTVEDRRTGRTMSHHMSYAVALKHRQKLSDQARVHGFDVGGDPIVQSIVKKLYGTDEEPTS
jgi:hypothetical protein